jgi:hypothetical protein
MAHRTHRSRLTDYGPEVYHPQGGLEVSQDHKLSKNTAEAQYAYVAPPQRRNLFFLERFAFGLLVGLLIAVGVGVAIGGGLGASLASCRRSNR